MDPINGVGHILRLVRTRLQKESVVSTKTAATAQRSTKKDVAATSGTPLESLKRRIKERISALEPNERTGKRATEIFVESVLIREFGDQLINDPEFANICLEVSKQLQAHPAAEAQMQEMFRALNE